MQTLFLVNFIYLKTIPEAYTLEKKQNKKEKILL